MRSSVLSASLGAFFLWPLSTCDLCHTHQICPAALTWGLWCWSGMVGRTALEMLG